jgi:fumarylpyruvate hydrolase
MMSIPVPQPVPTLAVSGGGAFPVHRIYCVGRNYAAHTREMGLDPNREEPFFFMKPADALVASGKDIAYPPMTHDFQHEIELVVAIGEGGRAISAEQAHRHVFGYAVGLDMTRRDLQMNARKQGRPWDMGKGFDESAPCAPLIPASVCGYLERGAIWLEVNGEVRQKSDIAHLIWSVPEVIQHLSRFVTLCPGDLIFTGTPEGVGPVEAGNVMEGHIDGLEDLRTTVVAPRLV